MNARRINAAAGVVLAAQKRRQTAAGIALALEAAGLLQSPESAAELDRLRGEVNAAIEWIDRNTPQPPLVPGAIVQVLAGLLRDERALRARVAELETQANCPSQMTISIGTSRCALPVRHGGDHRNADKNHYWSDFCGTDLGPGYACRRPAGHAGDCEPTPDPVEDPHDSPLHHTYALGHDLPEVTA